VIRKSGNGFKNEKGYFLVSIFQDYLIGGFGVGFYLVVRLPLIGPLAYGIAEAATAFIITKVQSTQLVIEGQITDPPPPPVYSAAFPASQIKWTNKTRFLGAPAQGDWSVEYQMQGKEIKKDI
jgi:hypothetical protein